MVRGKAGLSLILIGLFGWSIAAHAVKTPEQVLRERFIKAERTIDKVTFEQGRKLVSDLRGYPLTPYIELELISRNLADTAAVQAFLDKHPGTPMAFILKKRWLMYLANVGLTQPFLKNYQFGNDTELDCAALEMRLLSEPPAKVWPEVSNLWLAGESSLPKACDDLFKRWQKAGQRTPDVVWQRLLRVVEDGDSRIIPYLRTLLPAKQQYLADKWKQVLQEPSNVSKAKFLPLKHKWEREILAFGLKKMVWKQPDKALATFARFEPDPQFTKAQRIDVARNFAIALASKNDARAAKFLAMVPVAEKDELFVQWQIAWHLRRGEWPKVLEVIAQLPEDMKSDDSARYWQARALAETGQQAQADAVLKELAETRGYYGFMAAARMNVKPSLAHKPIPVSKDEYSAFKKSPAIARVKEWEVLDRPNAARREMIYIQRYGSEQQKLSAAKLDYENGWYDRAVVALANAGYWDDVELRFPMVYRREIQQHAKAANIDPAWAMAITRRESIFMPQVKSAAGAHGLMQIMPQTAKHIKGKAVRPDQLFNPGFNIDLGTDYLNYLMRTNNNNLALATASYNAGYGNVKKWIPEQPMALDVWVETIPFKETREYVKAVLAYYQIYNIRMNQKHDVFTPLVTQKVGQAS